VKQEGLPSCLFASWGAVSESDSSYFSFNWKSGICRSTCQGEKGHFEKHVFVLLQPVEKQGLVRGVYCVNVVEVEIDVDGDGTGDLYSFEPGYAGSSAQISETSYQTLDILLFGLENASGVDIELDTQNMSSHKGFCSNGDYDEESNEELSGLNSGYDYELVKNGSVDYSFEDVTIDSSGVVTDVKLRCLDYGGTTKLIVKVDDKEICSINIPLDEDEDGLADPWEDGVVDGTTVTTDTLGESYDSDDISNNSTNSNKGDNLEALDEYRGFMVGLYNIRHERTDPLKADVFYHLGSTLIPVPHAIDELGYEKHLMAAELFKDLSDEKRIVNFNTSASTKQACIVIYLDNNNEYLNGNQFARHFDDDGSPVAKGTPTTGGVIYVSTDSINDNLYFAPDDPNKTGTVSNYSGLMTKNVVQHEMGHSLYLDHTPHTSDESSNQRRCVMKYYGEYPYLQGFAPLSVEMYPCSYCESYTKTK